MERSYSHHLARGIGKKFKDLGDNEKLTLFFVA